MACLGMLVAQSSVAAESNAWEFEITPYLLAAGLNGQAGIRGVTADVDMSFSDILDVLDAGFMGMATARKDRWTFGLEGIYTKLSGGGVKTVTGPFGQVAVTGALDLTSSMYIYQGSVGYRVLDDTTMVDLIGGLRYTKLKMDASVVLTTVPAIVFPGGALSAGGSKDWTDAVAGVRVIHPVLDNVALVGYADVGAGGSDLTYQFILGADWEFKQDFIAKLGYRYLYWDYAKDGTVWDMSVSGPYLGLGIRF